MLALGTWVTQATPGPRPDALKPTLRFPQKYTEEVLSAADPSQPPPPPLQHFLEQPVQRVQQYQALLKVGWLSLALTTLSCPVVTLTCCLSRS